MNITPEVIRALEVLRKRVRVHGGPTLDFFDILDNAGIFSAIDEATGYDIDPAPEQVSKCTCPRSQVSFPVALGEDMHATGCPGDPAEWGDMAYTTAPARRACPNDGCTGEFAVNQDGSLRAHTNDRCEPCKADTREFLQNRIGLKF